MTTSNVSLTFSAVFLSAPVRPERLGANINIGGLALNTLKKLNGAKFGFPFASIVDAKAIGRGATALNSKPCKRAVDISDGFNDIYFPIVYQ
jgi:hypothetical protein